MPIPKIKPGFWSKLQKPIFILAPMTDVTDSAFRQTIARIAKPAVFFTNLIWEP